jgi:hypothetical protein
MKELLKEAEKLNDFRNKIIHWRPFLVRNFSVRPPKFVAASSSEMREKADVMDEIGNTISGMALYLYQGDGTLTFGSHLRKKIRGAGSERSRPDLVGP